MRILKISDLEREGARKNWQFIGAGHGVHWPDVDEDIGAEGMLKWHPCAAAARAALDDAG